MPEFTFTDNNLSIRMVTLPRRIPANVGDSCRRKCNDREREPRSSHRRQTSKNCIVKAQNEEKEGQEDEEEAGKVQGA
jgi:hypothetical protein